MAFGDLAPAIEYFDELLRADHRGTSALLSRATEERDLTFKGTRLCDSLRPFFIDPRAYGVLAEAAVLVAEGAVLLGRQLARDPALRSRLSLEEEDETLVRLDPNEHHDVIARIDGFVAEDGAIRFIEYNPMPSGFTWAHDLPQAFSELPVMRRFERCYACRYVPIRPLIMEALTRAHESRGGSGRPSIAILLQPAGAPADGSLLALPDVPKSIQMLLEAGWAVQMVHPESLEFRDGRLAADGFRIDTILASDWRRYLRDAGPEGPVWRAVRSGAAWILNSPSAEALRANKRAFALLSEFSGSGLFPPRIEHALKRHVPWTRIMRDGTTTYRGEIVDLPRLVERRRQALVLKPAKGSGGNGVVMGWVCDEKAWRAALDQALLTPYVVQERVPAPSDTYPFARGGELVFERRFYDVNPFVWNGVHMAGCLVRLSAGALMNVSAGTGSVVPAFLIDGPAGP